MIRNKKLFAILTLVCFMFTLMPVAAMASDGVIDTEAELKAAIENGGEVVLGGDITLTETTTSGSLQPGAAMIIDKALTIDGAGHTITIASTAGSRGFAIINNTDESMAVEFKNVSIVSEVSGGRCIDTRSDYINLTLNKVNLTAITGSYTQPLTIGGSDKNGLTVDIINGSTITAGHYGIITFVPVTLNIENCTNVAGYGALYFKEGSAGTKVNLINSTLTGKAAANNHVSNTFGTVIFETSGVEVNVDKDSAIVATETTTSAKQVAFLFKNDSTATVKLENGAVVSEMIKSAERLTEAIADPYVTDITLINSFEVNEKIDIDNAITLDLNQNTITGTAKNIFYVSNDVTIKNGTIKNTVSNGRCVNTRKAVELVLNNVVLQTTGSGNTQPVTLGVAETGITKIHVKDSVIEAGNAGYGIIDFVKANITVENTDISGYAALYFKEGSNGSTVDVVNSDLSCVNNHDGEDNNFGTVVFQDGGIDVSIDSNSTVYAEANGTASQFAFIVPESTVTEDVIITLANGATVATEGDNAKVLINGRDYVLVTLSDESSVITKENKIMLDNESASILVEDTVELNVMIGDKNVSGVEWSTSDASVATVSNGVVTAVGAGTATITAKAGDATATCDVTVKAKHTVIFKNVENATEVKVVDGDKVAAPEDPTLTGMTFEGWYSDAEYKTKYDFDTAVTGDITLYAKWKENSSGGVVGGDSYVGGGSYTPSTSDKTESSTTTTVTPSGDTVKVETETKTEADGTKVETETTTTTTTTGETTKVETTTETKTDGTTVETTTTTTATGETTKVEVTTETNDEGTTVETTVTTDAQGETSTTVTATLDNGSAVTNNDKAVEVEVTKVEEKVVETVQEAVAADENVEVVGTADNAVSVRATNASTGAAQTSFVQPMAVSVPVDNTVLNNVEDTSKLTLAKVVTNEDGTTELVYMGGSYDEETGKFNAKVNEDGDYILVEKADLVKIELNIGETDIKHNDKATAMEVAPRINEDNRTMLQLSYIADALGCQTFWDGATRTVTVVKGDITLTMVIDEVIPGFDTKAVVENGRTLVPAGYISGMLGANVIWDPVDQQVIIVK